LNQRSGIERMKKYALFSAAALLLGAVLWMVFHRDGVGPPPQGGYDYSRPSYEPVVHPGIAEFEIAPADLTGEIAVDRSSRSAARDALVAVIGKCKIGETKVTEAFVRAELYTIGRDDRRLIHQQWQTTAQAVAGELPYRIELRTPANSARLRLRVEVVHFPWDFDPKSDSLPDDFTTDSIADGEFVVK
jgi:hypothetical protein